MSDIINYKDSSTGESSKHSQSLQSTYKHLPCSRACLRFLPIYNKLHINPKSIEKYYKICLHEFLFDIIKQKLFQIFLLCDEKNFTNPF